MKIVIADTYDQLSVLAANDIIGKMNLIENPLICTASGDSPTGIYKEFVRLYKENRLDTSDWYFVGLDEWMGMNENDEGSCRYHLEQQLFQPLHVSGGRLCFFDGRQPNADLECDRIETFMLLHQQIQVAIIGLGLNGHIGMNEPHTPAHIRTHIADIDPLTAQTGQKYFKEARTLTQGLTLGIANLMEAKYVSLVVSGSKKAAIVKQVLEGEISTAVPASLLRNHPGFTIYLDAEAASLLHKAHK
ncbi:glucosamine-6-phosphate deaminase [Limnovirga soli]|uniref:Glucosamine-6-phosphate deaminase n=1 Tax=Limnovirga soli TaxID=2656915 RepID=A0A8J8FDZ7_9BACT|nr:glucosamine-6-phosphate deaminase [Limnovirga soli]NNV54196.1 glucosamine-6-phosphate deaminase [Limnovirga soli]